MKLFKLSALTLALATVAAVQAAPTIDANLELDSTSITNKGIEQNGRVEVNIASKTGADSYVQGRASVIAGKSGTAGVDDMWVKMGNAAAGLQLGRFEAADLFPLGKDTIVEKAGSFGYNGNTLRGRVGTAPASFHGALSFNLGAAASVELGLINHKDNAAKVSGVRPVFKTSFGGVSLAIGAESIKTTTSATTPTVQTADLITGVVTSTGGVTTLTNVSSHGLGVTAGFKVAGGDVNVNLAKSGNARSIGANGTFGGLGLGLIQDKTGTSSGKTIYAAYTLPLLGVAGASITPAVSKSTATGAAGVTGLKVRVNYAF